MASSYGTCRILNRNGNQCTGEAQRLIHAAFQRAGLPGAPEPARTK
ncbi:hypothetical protein [Streptomyces antibioticus]